MRRRKQRLTVTIDGSLLEAGNAAVSAGRADSLSGWVNSALSERAEKERRLEAMAEAIAVHEARFGTISPGELLAQERADRCGSPRDTTPHAECDRTIAPFELRDQQRGGGRHHERSTNTLDDGLTDDELRHALRDRCDERADAE